MTFNINDAVAKVHEAVNESALRVVTTWMDNNPAIRPSYYGWYVTFRYKPQPYDNYAYFVPENSLPNIKYEVVIKLRSLMTMDEKLLCRKMPR